MNILSSKKKIDAKIPLTLTHGIVPCSSFHPQHIEDTSEGSPHDSFSLTKFTLSEPSTHEIVQIGDQTELSVNIPEIKTNSSFIINYDLSGLGNYQNSEPVVIILDKND
ncbi:MAG: hypothetical protein ACFFCI_25355 [Promethearchaeota archaeon]